MNARMPTIFFGHGSPMNVLHDNDWTRGWTEIGQRLPRSRAVLSISAHWYLPGTAVTAMASWAGRWCLRVLCLNGRDDESACRKNNADREDPLHYLSAPFALRTKLLSSLGRV